MAQVTQKQMKTPRFERLGNQAAELWHLHEVDRGLRRQIERSPARFNHADMA